MNRAIIVPNYTKKESVDFSETVLDFLKSKGCVSEIVGEEEEIKNKNVDFAIVLGGDGTILRTSRKLYGKNIPMLGVNFGHIGYLTGCNPENAFPCIDKILNNEYSVENRLMISGDIERENRKVFDFIALNEVTLFRASLMKAVHTVININNTEVCRVCGDGTMVSTPTGSTSYNLSAGGPVLPPLSENLIITPISPRFFPSRSIVCSGKDIISIIVKFEYTNEDNNCPKAEIDSDISFELKSGDKVTVKKAEFSAPIIKVNDNSFYSVFNKKLFDINGKKDI